MTIQLDYLPNIAAIFMLMFARMGTMVMLLPALGESTIPTRFRLTIALALTIVLYPVGSQYYPADLTSNTYRMIALLFGELAIGFGIGLCAKMITSVLQIAGMIMANQSGLAFALGTDFANQGQQGALFGNFLSILGITLVFVSDSHFLVIAALHDSFTIFPPGLAPPVGDFSQNATETVAHVFSIAVRMSAPFSGCRSGFLFRPRPAQQADAADADLLYRHAREYRDRAVPAHGADRNPDDVLSGSFSGIARQVHRGVALRYG